jgi:hypothetical protein
MSINYIKENLKKFDHDNLISFLFDIIIRGGLDDIEDYDIAKEYHKNEKIYFKDLKGTHHIYKCIVENATVGEILPDEWMDLLQSFRKPIISEETIVASLDLREEVLISTEENQKEFKLKTPGVEEGLYTVVVYHPELGRLAQTDFSLAGDFIILEDEFIVKEVGGKLIVDLYQNM